LTLSLYQISLPGLHYDEAKEAGVNAMQLLQSQPVTAFRGAVLRIGSLQLPLMVQDYIGALNVYLAIPFLALGGINVPALRLLPILTSALTLVLVYVFAREMMGQITAAVVAMLLAINPSFVFWSREGIFVTNITATLAVGSLLALRHWYCSRRSGWFYLTAFLWGLGLWAKLLFIWVIGATVGIGLLWWASNSWSQMSDRLPLRLGVSWKQALLAGASFLAGLWPLILFNLRTSGTLIAIFHNLGRSYYGVDNQAFGANLVMRLQQLRVLLRGDHFWYLGGVYANRFAPWITLALVVGGVLACLRKRSQPEAGRSLGALGWLLLFVALLILQSCF
ncbi:MAG TPA: phospholipid carrier-dependent glycosyltransferase, partial [Anaerolineae bacterium]|nr:phospholipid carrier-dependent glycosyltransferase [Anaerolineae bacterium]